MMKINIKGLTKISQANANRKKALYGMLISDKVEFKTLCIKQHKFFSSEKLSLPRKCEIKRDFNQTIVIVGEFIITQNQIEWRKEKV